MVALNPAYFTEEEAPVVGSRVGDFYREQSKNRVGRFFSEEGNRVGENEPQTLIVTIEITLYGYDTASDVHIYLYANAAPTRFVDPSGNVAGLAELNATSYVIGVLAILAIPATQQFLVPALENIPPIDLSPSAIFQSSALSRAQPQVRARDRVLPRRRKDGCQAIIGENWRRVVAAKTSRFPKAETFTWPDEAEAYLNQADSAERLPPLGVDPGLANGSYLGVLENANYLWINNIMRRGCQIIDIGFDESRPDYEPLFYYSELEWTRGYTNKRFVKFPGSGGL